MRWPRVQTAATIPTRASRHQESEGQRQVQLPFGVHGILGLVQVAVAEQLLRNGQVAVVACNQNPRRAGGNERPAGRRHRSER